MLPQAPDRKVKLPVPDPAFISRGAPTRIVDALLRLHDDVVHLVHEIFLLGLQAADDVSLHGARVQGDGRDGRVAARQLRRVLHVGELALPVAGPLGAGAKVLRRPEAFELDAAGEGVHEAEGGEEEDARVARLRCRPLEGGEEQLDEEGVREVVHSELVLVAIFREGGVGGHDAGVADEDVERGVLGEERSRGFFDGGEG